MWFFYNCVGVYTVCNPMKSQPYAQLGEGDAGMSS